MQWTLIALAVGVLGSSIALVLRRDVDNGLVDLGGAITALVYLGLMFGFAVRLRMALPGPIGAWVVLIWILIVKFTDVGAYFTGMAVGRRPLIPEISPKKTIEGSLGGLVLGILMGVIGWIALPGIRPVFEWGPLPSFWGLLISAVSLSVLGQFGDLVESLLKRSAAAKDSGSAIPTFGGILDVVDSLILTAPVAWMLLAAWPAE
jgi:phosphatidate cytidylyltransferase